MNTKVYFSNFEKTDALLDYANGKFENVLAKFPKFKGETKVKLEIENSTTQPGKDLYTVEVKYPVKRGGFRVLKTTKDNMYTAISLASDRLKHHLGRLHKRLIDRRRHRRNEPDYDI